MADWHILYQNPEMAQKDGEELESALAARGRSSLAEAKRWLFRSLRKEMGDRRAIRAMEEVPRELFVPAESFHLAYEDGALPIGEGQTISQPFIVALMTEALDLKGDEKVLEVGTGSGYQAAILAHLARQVVSVERKESLLVATRRRLATLDIRNVELRLAGETMGWPHEAPYQAIIVTAAAPRVPKSLVEQLDEGGRMVVPTGDRQQQQLVKMTKVAGRLSAQGLGGCAFVPLIGGEAWEEEE